MKKILIIFISLFCLSSCDSYLDIKPHNKIIPESTDDFSSMIQKTLHAVDFNSNDRIFDSEADLMHKEAYAKNLESSLFINSVIPFYIGSSLPGKTASYSAYYAEIANFNIIIEEVKANDKESKELLAVTHALRGICYYNLMVYYSEPYDPANAKTQLGASLIEEFSMEARPIRSSIFQTAELIEEDLKKAIEFNCTTKDYRITQDVAKAYLARFYYWTHNWTEAAKIASELVAKYPILNGDEYKHMINTPFVIAGNEIFCKHLYNENATEESYKQPMAHLENVYPSLEFINLMNDNDIRKSLFFGTKKIIVNYKEVERLTTIKPLIVRIRSAEMAFIAAESYAYLKKDTEALNYLNMIRRNRVAGFVDYTSASLPDVDPEYLVKVDAEGNPLSKLVYNILTERQIEFFCEGDRWLQLKMHGRPEFYTYSIKGTTNYTQKYSTQKYMYTYPIAITDCDLIEGLKQNPGYEYNY
ncbi:MAG: RagB/SusD family nutrient uptake outer membrane protein [Marinifilaceae bacterium]|jgi:hypothetical protein|nr:RagB/SusD family nutrient uptake outer membrane protein [Marinifilaceae bacterium]